MAQQSSADLAKQFGGAQVADIAAQFGGKPVEAPTRQQETTSQPSGGSTLRDVGIGAAKGAGRGLFEIGKLALAGANATNPLAVMQTLRAQSPEWLESSNNTQSMAGLIPDAASLAMPGGMITRGSRLIPRAAVAIERRAIPAMTREGAEFALSRGAGRVSGGNADALVNAAKSQQGARSPTGQWMPGPAGVRNAAASMADAVKVKTPITNAEIVTTLGSGMLLQSPTLTAALGVANFLRRPRVSSAIAQGLHTSAPAINAAAGGGASLAAIETLKRLFGGDE